MKKDRESAIKHEKEHWDRVFLNELEKVSDKKFSSYWWENYYEEIINNLDNLLVTNNLYSILEAGSGSGKATILLDRKSNKTFLDISRNALKFAMQLSRKFETKNPKLIEGNIFDMPFNRGVFDFVWNIGVIEHYSSSNMELILSEMVRVCSNKGIVAVGFPNFYSGPILKAWLLKFKLLKFVPGYRLDTENFYEPSEIMNLLKLVCHKQGRIIEGIKTLHLGSPLIMETPKLIFKLANPIVSRILMKNKFLILIICKFHEEVRRE